MSTLNNARMLIGWREWVALPTLGIPLIKAKVDTGARTSSLHAFDVQTFTRAGRQHVRFQVHPLESKHGRHDIIIECEAPVADYRLISDSGGHRERRYVIEAQVQIGALAYPIEITLANRETMSHRMLLGRTAMKMLMIDPNHSYLLGKPERIVGSYLSLAKTKTTTRKKAAKKKLGKPE